MALVAKLGLAKPGLPTRRQAIVLASGAVLAIAAFAGLASGHAWAAIASILVMQLLVIGLILAATHRISQRIAASGPSRPASPARRRAARSRASLPRTAMAALGALRFYARTNKGKHEELVSQLVLDRSIDGRDILAHEASGGTLDFNGVRTLLECFRSPPKRARTKRIVRRYDRAALLSLARVLYRQEALADDLLNAITLFQLVKVVFGRKALEQRDAEWLVSALLQERRQPEAVAWARDLGLEDNTPNWHYLLANATNPHVHACVYDETAWLRHLNAGLVREGLEPMALAPGTEPPFGRLRASTTDRVEGDAPMISVIMPVYRPEATVDIAINAVLSQTWRNLELIIVVDGGPAELPHAIERWVAADARVRVIRCAANRGTYTARNIGLEAARGEFVTCHDADDWSHPRRLELQAADLLANPARIANTTRLLRVTADLEVRHRSPSPQWAHTALVSLMFRRQPVMARIGYWDSVRKMGDAEFLRRMELAFDQEIQSVGSEALYFALHDAGSLSGSDMHRGFMHPERQVYRARYRAWHGRIADGEASAWLPMNPKSRPFPAPSSFLPVRPPGEEFDVVFVSELGFSGGNAHSLVHEMTICVESGLRVGLVHARNLLFTHLARREPMPALDRLLAEGAVTELALTSDVRARLVVVRWPACFQFTSSVKPAIVADRTVVVANHPPYEGRHGRHSYEMSRVSRNVREAFGAEPEWAPQSRTIRRMLEPQLPHGGLLDIDWVAVLSEEPRAHRRLRPSSAVPVVGRHSRDHHLKWPDDRETLLKVYPADGSVEVRVLGGIDKVLASGVIDAEDARHWQVHPFGSLAPMDFLQTIDFFVYYHHKDWVEAFGRVIMEAMFAGTVVVLPPSFEPVFGDAAVYAEPDGVQGLVHAYHADWQRYEAQSARGMAYARDNCTPAAYRRRLAALGLDLARAQAQPGAA
jgi:hypothetical protein